MKLNERALAIVEEMIRHKEERRIVVSEIEGGGRLVDCGIDTPGGLGAGVDLARVCLAGLGSVSVGPGEVAGRPVPVVSVASDHPVAACLASQYAGWQIVEGKFFAMGSGPMRAAYGHGSIYDRIGYREKTTEVVGVLEGRKRPTPEVVGKLADACGVAREKVTLLIAPTASLAGGVQVVARSVETALHKLSELPFDLKRVVSAFGSAPMPPVAKDDLKAIGRTNDAILYGARVILFVTGDDDSLLEMGHQVPSSSSEDHGEPFSVIFERYNHDFYAVDPHLFSPAEVVFQNVESGQTHVFGGVEHEVMARSFF